MENVSAFINEDEQMELPPGFRFHPTDEELISHYLSPKVLDSAFTARAIGEVDLNKCEPWDLPCKSLKTKTTCLCFPLFSILFYCDVFSDFVFCDCSMKGGLKWVKRNGTFSV